MTLPSGLTEPLGWVGLEWPQADEELLFEAGQQWLSFAQDLTNLAQDANTTAAKVWQVNEGETSQAFETWWIRDQGPQQRLNEDAQAATLIGQALMVFAAITLALKINFIVQLVILTIEVAQAIAAAFVSFGATTAEVPGFVAATRLILRRLIREVIQHVTTSIKTIFQRAQHLLRKVASRRGSHAATDATRHTPGIPGPMTVRRFEGKPHAQGVPLRNQS